MALDAKKIVFGTYRTSLPHHFYTEILVMVDERWKLFFFHRVLFFHNHLQVSENGIKNMSLDRELAPNDVAFNKSDFNRTHVAVRSSVLPRKNTEGEKKHIRGQRLTKRRKRMFECRSTNIQDP